MVTNNRKQRSKRAGDASICLCSPHPPSYPQAVMDKIKEMSEGIVVIDAPTHRTTMDGMKAKRSATTGETLQSVFKKLTVFTFSACVKLIEFSLKMTLKYCG